MAYHPGMAIRWKNSKTDWGAVARAFHWIIALLIIAQMVLGKVADEMSLSPTKIDLFVWHKSIGVTLLLLVIARLAWRLANPAPSPAAGVSTIETRLAFAGHTLLYLLMIAVPVTGWLASDASIVPLKIFWLVPAPDLIARDRELSEIAGEVHEGLSTALAVVALGHIAAALRHHFWLRDATLSRMLPFGKER